MSSAGVLQLIKSGPVDALLRLKIKLANSQPDGVLNLFLSGLLVAIGYYVGARVGFALTPPQKATAAFWPPNAILLATFLIVPRKRWWFLVLAVLPAHLLVQLPRGIPIGTSLGWFLGNIGEGLLGAYVITAFQNVRESFERVRGLVVFLAVGVVGAPLLTSFPDAGVVIGSGASGDFWHVLTNRLFSNMLAELTVVPTIVLFYIHGKDWLFEIGWTKYLETILLALVVVSAAIYTFASGLSEPGKYYSLYLLLLLLAWATLRFQVVGLSTTLLAVCLISSWAVVHGDAPFVASPQNVIPLQVFLFMVALPSMFIAVVLVQQRETANSLRASKAQLVNSQEQERSRIARELHDGVGQLLALLNIKITELEEQCDFGMKSKLEELELQVGEISTVTHEISHNLHPSHLENLGLCVAVRKLCADFRKEQVTPIDFDEANVPEHLSLDVSLAFYRIAQEALHNAIKYSSARRIEVSLRAKSGRLWLAVNDDGVGFRKMDEASAGMGLMNMQERMESIGGTVSIRSGPGRGTRVHASIPLRESGTTGRVQKSAG